MANNVIKEFLISLGYEVDEGKQKKFTQGLEFAQAKAVALGEAMYDLARKVAEAVTGMAIDFDRLYFQTERLNSSAADIKGFSYALTQLGASGQGANAALENLAEFAKSSPGAGRWLENLGVSPKDLGDSVAMARDLEKTFQAMPYYRAKAYANVIGIDPLTLQAMIRDQDDYEKQYKDFTDRLAKDWGVSIDDIAGSSNRFMTQYRELKMELGTVVEIALFKAMQTAMPYLEQFSRWVRDMITGKHLSVLSQALRTLIIDIGDLLKALGDLAATPAVQKFATAMMNSIGHMIASLGHLIEMVADLLQGHWINAWHEAKAYASEFGAGLGFGGGAAGSGAAASGSGGAASGGTPSPGDPVSGGGATGDSRTARASQAESYFRSQGYSAGAAKGIAAALWSESGLNEHRWNGQGSGAYGLGQWLSKDRVAEFRRLFGHSLQQSTYAEQLQFVAYELAHKYRGVGNQLKGAGIGAVSAADLMIFGYEKPGDGTPGDRRRARNYIGSGGNVAINQQTNIHVNGGNAKDTADHVAANQNDVNQRLVSNASVFAY